MGIKRSSRSWAMISDFRVYGWSRFRSCDRYFDPVNPLLSWCKITAQFKELVRIKLLLIWFEVNFIEIFLRDFNAVFNFSLRKIFHFDFFNCVHTCKSWCKEYSSLIVKFYIGLGTSPYKRYFGICSRHIIHMDSDI